MRKIKEVVIDGHTYQMTQVGAETGDAVLFRLGRGLALSDLAPADYTFVRDVFKNQTKLQIVDTKGDGRKSWVSLADSFDEHFAGRYQALAEWLRISFEWNFSGFLGVVLAGVQSRAGALRSNSLLDVLGGSGESSPPTGSESGA